MPSNNNSLALQISNEEGILWQGFMYKFCLRLLLRINTFAVEMKQGRANWKREKHATLCCNSDFLV